MRAKVRESEGAAAGVPRSLPSLNWMRMTSGLGLVGGGAGRKRVTDKGPVAADDDACGGGDGAVGEEVPPECECGCGGGGVVGDPVADGGVG